MELVFGIVILSLVSIALVQVTLSLHRHSIVKTSVSLAQISLSNAADVVRNHLEMESSFVFIDSTLQSASHTISLQGDALLLDGVLLAQDITRFDVKTLPNSAFSIDVCTNLGGEAFCINRVGWLR
ncbi:hypothetical protein [Helicobacter sp.]|uniref:hypothetical protein n=1 Tax=Helicobacter sp. TaxID=218 RepID=UPI0025BF6CD9|nr:hypothetical protein [Helicobacter sp.]MBR2494921.1 hypothetical protein [Helicobacter sp.]